MSIGRPALPRPPRKPPPGRFCISSSPCWPCWPWPAPFGRRNRGAAKPACISPTWASASFLGGINGHNLLLGGIVVSALGLVFGLIIFVRLRNMPVHSSMREVSELIYETCKTYLGHAGEVSDAAGSLHRGHHRVLFRFPVRDFEAYKVAIILLFSVIGISGSFSVAAFGMRVNTFANSRTAFAALRGKAFPCYDIPLQAGMSIGMLLVSVELLIMLFILLFIPGDLAGACFIGFAIGESLGAAALRVAGGIFTKIADIGSDLMKIVFKIKEDDVRNPGVIADCTGDNAGDSVGPSADGFETYGVTGVALITFILLAVHDPVVQVQLLVWIFSMRVMMVISSAVGYFINGAIAKARYRQRREVQLRSAAHHAGVADFDPLHRAHLRRQLLHDSDSRRRRLAVVEAGHRHQLRHAGRRAHSRVRQGLHLHQLAPRARDRHQLARGRRVAQHSLRLRGGQFQRLLAGLGHAGR